jgi:hypothetical protein
MSLADFRLPPGYRLTIVVDADLSDFTEGDDTVSTRAPGDDVHLTLTHHGTALISGFLARFSLDSFLTDIVQELIDSHEAMNGHPRGPRLLR